MRANLIMFLVIGSVFGISMAANILIAQSFGAFGPWLVTPDEAGDLGPLRLQTRLNGEVVQDTTISQMIFDIPRQIEYCSQFTRLEPGDVIVTGTPGGVGSRRTPPLWMKAGDVVEIEIDRIGLLRNTVADET